MDASAMVEDDWVGSRATCIECFNRSAAFAWCSRTRSANALHLASHPLDALGRDQLLPNRFEQHLFGIIASH
jgi:hypothetical protein